MFQVSSRIVFRIKVLLEVNGTMAWNWYTPTDTLSFQLVVIKLGIWYFRTGQKVQALELVFMYP